MKKILKIILIVFNSILLLLFVGSTLAGWIAPSRSIVFSYLSYGYLYLLFANVAFIILWLCLKSKWFLMSTVAIVLRFAFLPLFFQIGGSETLPNGIDESECIKLLTFNAHRFQGNERQEPMTDTNMKLFLEVVDEEQPDILTMQEYIGRGDTLHLTDQLTRRGYVYQVSGYNNGSMTGTVIFSKLPLFNEVHLDGVKCYADMLWRGDTVRLSPFISTPTVLTRATIRRFTSCRMAPWITLRAAQLCTSSARQSLLTSRNGINWNLLSIQGEEYCWLATSTTPLHRISIRS